MPDIELLVLGTFGISLAAAVGYLALGRRLLHVLYVFFFVLFAVAGLFVLGGSEFLALSQLIVYVGGILVLLLFGTMLMGRSRVADEAPRAPLGQFIPAVLVVSLLGAGAVWAFSQITLPIVALNTPPGTPQLGAGLLSTHAPIFELASLILLLALAGAAYYARRSAIQGRQVRPPASHSSPPISK